MPPASDAPQRENIFRSPLTPAGEKWLGQSTRRQYGTLPELRASLPTFEAKPFSYGGTNECYDMIIRRPVPGESFQQPVPVAAVSKKYVLFQHWEVIDSVANALQKLRIKAAGLQAELRVSVYQERMHLRLALPQIGIDPGDRQPMILVLNCLNSVDKSLALEISVGWYRQICSNGMMGLVKRSRLRRIHTESLDTGQIAAYLKEAFAAVPEEQKTYARWMANDLPGIVITRWADDPLAKAWGSHAAARTLHILKTGYDGAVVDRAKRRPASMRVVVSGRKVPGAFAPASNAFHISQALSWVAGQRTAVQEQIERLKSIPKLMADLVGE